MKNQKNNLIFWTLTVGCGALAGFLRLRLMDTGLDGKGLLTRGNPLAIALWVLSIACLLALILGLRRLEKGRSFQDNFPAGKFRGCLSALGGLVLLYESGTQIPTQLPVGILGVLAGFSMVAAGLCRFNGKRPNPLFHTCVCVYYIILLIFSFRDWSADPQLQDYALQLMACVCLMLFSFHRASCDAGVINRRRTAFFGLAAVYFCLASLSDESMPLAYLASGLWAAGAGGTLENLPARE